LYADTIRTTPGNTEAMTIEREALQASWNRTRNHLDAARTHLTGLANIDLSAISAALASQPHAFHPARPSAKRAYAPGYRPDHGRSAHYNASPGAVC
jgi:hypothetical protein